MGYRTKKEVLKTIANRDRGGRIVYDAYLGYDPITKKQRRMQNCDLKKLKEDIELFYLSIKSNGDLGVILKPHELLDARKAYDILYKHGCHMTLEDIVSKHVSETAPKETVGKSIGEAYDEYYFSFTSAQELHKKAVRSRVGGWVSAFGSARKLPEVTAKEVVEWLSANHGESNKTYNNYLTYIKSFLTWCAKSERGYLEKNPLTDTSTRTIAYKEPEYVSVDDAVKMMKLLEDGKTEHPEYVVYAALSFFCGIRREEIMRMATIPDAANVNLEDETIRIAKPKGWTKGISPRAFHIPHNARLWLQSVDYATAVGKIGDKTTENIYELAGRNGIKMPKNAGRHSFITYHVAAYGDPSKTEAMVGTSKKMRVNNYCGLASKKDGEAYFAITPSV